MKIKRTPVLGIALWVLAAASGAGGAEESAIDVEAYNECLLEKLRTAADDTPVSKIRQACLAASQDSTVGEPAEPLPDRLGREFRAIVGPDVGRQTSREKEVREGFDDLPGRELPRHADCQTPPRELIDDDQHPVDGSVRRPILDEVVRPDVVRPLGSPAKPSSRRKRAILRYP